MSVNKKQISINVKGFLPIPLQREKKYQFISWTIFINALKRKHIPSSRTSSHSYGNSPQLSEEMKKNYILKKFAPFKCHSHTNATQGVTLIVHQFKQNNEIG